MKIMAVMGKGVGMLKNLYQKILFRIRLSEMDSLWRYMGGSCWGLFPSSFYYTHTEEEIEQITSEAFKSLEKMLEEFQET